MPAPASPDADAFRPEILKLGIQDGCFVKGGLDILDFGVVGQEAPRACHLGVSQLCPYSPEKALQSEKQSTGHFQKGWLRLGAWVESGSSLLVADDRCCSSSISKPLWENLGKGEMGRCEFADKGRFGSIPPVGPI